MQQQRNLPALSARQPQDRDLAEQRDWPCVAERVGQGEALWRARRDLLRVEPLLPVPRDRPRAVRCYALAVPAEEARRQATRTSITAIEQAVQIFAMRHNGKLPDSLEELTTGTDDAPGLLKEGAMNDSWGTPFGYTKQGKKFKVSSAGPDGEMGTEDDLTN